MGSNWLSIDERLELEGYKFEFEYGYYDYDWSLTKVFTKDRRLFSLAASGCSCNSWEEYWFDVQSAIGDMDEIYQVPTIEELESDWYGKRIEPESYTVQDEYRRVFSEQRS